MSAKKKLPLAVATAACMTPGAWASGAAADMDRSVLPIPEPKAPVSKQLDARNAQMPPRFEVQAPAGAPNVVIVLIDDLGFGVPGSFGGPVPMPTLDKLAQNGLRYNNFHTTALSSPGLHLRGRRGPGAPQHAVLRGRGQPRDLPRGLVRAHDPQGALGAKAKAVVGG